MAALAANTALNLRTSAATTRQNRVIKTSKKIYKHAIVTQIKSSTTNLAEPATNDAAANVFLGIAEEECLTGDGTRTVTVLDGGCDVEFPIAATVTKALVNQIMYAQDDSTITNLTTLGPSVGTLVAMSATSGYGWVRLRVQPMTVNT